MISVLSSFSNISDISFWTKFAQVLLTTTNVYLDSTSFHILENILLNIHLNPCMLIYIAHFLRILTNRIDSEHGKIIGISINKILFTNQSIKNQNYISEFLKAVTALCTKNENIKLPIFNQTIKKFSNFLISSSNNNSIYMLSLFQLEISLISQCPETRSYIDKNITPLHIQCLFYNRVVKEKADSISQMFILEWIWRVVKCCFKDNKRKKEIFSDPRIIDYESFFDQINPNSKYRSSLHKLIRLINSKSSNEFKNLQVKYVKFENVFLNSIALNAKGWIDVSFESFAVWFTRKKAQFPDLIIFKFSQIYQTNISFESNILSFVSKEKLRAFECYSKTNPMRFEFRCANLTEEIASFIKLSFKSINVKKERKKSNIACGKDQMKTDSNPQTKRIHIDKIISGNKKHTMNKLLDKIIEEYNDSTIKKLNDAEERVCGELIEIVRKTTDIIKSLNQLSEAHKMITNNAISENNKLAKKLGKLEEELDQYEDMTNKKKLQMIDEFAVKLREEKQKFIMETNEKFSQNVLVAFSNDLKNLRSHTKDENNLVHDK